MTMAAAEPARVALETAARELSERHAAVEPRARPLDSLDRIASIGAWLDRARVVLADPAPEAAKAAEWVLDNDYLVERAIRQIRRDLSPGFYKRLPALAQGPERGLPRAYVLPHAFLKAAHLHVSLAGATTFVQAYQQDGSWLTIAELWAFPALLRLACLELLVTAVARLVPELTSPVGVAAPNGLPLDETECVARSLVSLRAIAAIPWKTFFEETNRVEAILRTDPVGVYARMDFETRDRYRAAVEEIAEWGRLAESHVAERVVTHAGRAKIERPAAAHIGSWLIGEGRETFERLLGCRLPLRIAAWRWGFRHARALYASALVAGTVAALTLPVWYLETIGASIGATIAGAAVALLPGSVVAVTLVHWLVTRLVPPRVLPKLDFERGIPPDCATAVVIPALVGSVKEAGELLERLEEHYLANPASSVQFALLTDLPDSPVEWTSEDEAREAALVEGIRLLNARHGCEGGHCFHLLHRRRRYNPAEGCWMGWERKRGKLDELNRLVLGQAASGFAVQEANVASLQQVRFVVTVDADTRLPQGAVARLAGTLAHPLNHAQFDEATGRVRSGYTVVQPRVEISPESGTRSLFARLYSGDTAIDIYSRAVSDVYQDLFGSGIYIGKGIYDVETFHRSLDGRVPENALASHDLFEGAHGRVGLATDIVLYESFPSQYEVYARRWHRWIRGDWQLLPWLGRRVPGAGGARLPNRLPLVERWKIADNLRRSLMPPALLALLIAGWLALPGGPWVWTALALLAPSAWLFTDLVTGLAGGRRRGAVRGVLRRFVDHAGRWLLVIVFLVPDAVLCLDAILRTLGRMYVSRRRLLEWTTAAHVARGFTEHSRAASWRRLWTGPAAALLLAIAIVVLQPAALWPAAPLLALWIASPEIARRMGRPRTFDREPLDEDARTFLRLLARRTWLFFERFAGPDDHWLPPDNFQEHPGGELAHRTSPTNVGMLLLSSVAAWDLGFVALPELAIRVRNTLDTLGRLERHRGHLFNWYETRTLVPLEPRYVSTVDSGNLAVSLLTLKEACREAARGPALQPQTWLGLRDLFALLEKAAADLPAGSETTALHSAVHAFGARAAAAAPNSRTWSGALARLAEHDRSELDRLVSAAVGQKGVSSRTLQEIRVWVERIRHHLRSMHRDSDTLAPWLAPLDAPPPGGVKIGERTLGVLSPLVPLDETAARCRHVRAMLAAELAGQPGNNLRAWIERLAEAVERGEQAAVALGDTLMELGDRAEALALEMDFRPLYDPEPKLFRIGYNVTSDRLDPHHYDLLATEARLASFFAIAKGDVPLEHWFHLGRPITSIAGRLALVSWGGSIFEYLMPALVFRPHPGTLLTESERTAVDAQRRFARELGIPWGMSESGFASLDPGRHYRYQAFGVPTLGLRRGLSRELVVAPYATALALAVRPHDAVANLRELERLGMLGLYGMYEAADFRAERVPRTGAFALVRSWMAHHQGMVLAAIDAALCDNALVRRFHADRRVRTVEVLLQERVPREVPTEAARGGEPRRPSGRRPAPALLEPWEPAGLPGVPRMHLLGNGRLSSWISEGGAGLLRWHGQALTRWIPDSTRDHHGVWVYVRDEESGALWSAGRQPTAAAPAESATVFHAHLAEFRRRDHGIALRMEVAVLPADDIEARRISLTNEGDRPRTLSLTTYGEVVLGPSLDDERHPAFSKLFVQSEWIPSAPGLLFTRRPRHHDERPAVLLHGIVADASLPIDITGYESDRRAFLGRHGDRRRPRGVAGGLSGTTGWTLDPVFALQVRVALEPGQRGTFFFLTAAAGSRESALDLAERYNTPTALDWALDDAAMEAAHEARRLALEPSDLPRLQALASLLLNPHAALRAAPARRAANQLGQSRLWGLGISGDAPLLLLRTDDPRSVLLALLVRGHALWHRRGLVVDLIVLRSGSSSYSEPLRDRLTEVLEEVGGHATLGRQGGVHLVLADQIRDEEAHLLECSARVVVDEAFGDLDRQLEAPVEPAELPAFEPVTVPPALPPVADVRRAADLVFDNGLGGFTPDGREYVVHLPPGAHTPAPWCNVLANDSGGTIVSEAGLGFTWSLNSGENRLTPWSNDPVLDLSGEALYLRDEEDAQVWTPTPRPAGDATACEIRHGAGYTVWTRRSHGLEQRLVAFVPPDDPVKIVRLQLRNLWDRPRRVTATYYAEWLLGALPSVARPHIVTAWEPAGPCLVASSPWIADFGERVAFLASTLPPHSVTTDRREFVGFEGDLRSPAGLRRWGLSGRTETNTDPCACYQVHLGLRPEGSVEAVFVLGQGDGRRHAVDLAQRWRDPAQVDRAWEALRAHWDRLLGAVQVRTPDPALDLMVNRWLLYQTLASRVLARAGFYQAGGAIGFRDQLQDVLALVHADPGRTRAHILACAARQFEEGDVLHWWHPPSGRGIRTRCSDDLLWLPWATIGYIEATGDRGILDEEVPFLRAPVLAPDERDRYGRFEPSPDRRPLFEHCERALERGVTRGAHGLPLIGAGDWNDGLDRVGARGNGESIWLAWFAIVVMNGFAPLCTGTREELGVRWRARARELARAVEDAAWDGQWYVRAFDDDGRPWGSQQNEECRIDSLPQSWAVLAGVADPERARQALAAADRELADEGERLMRLLWPPFDSTPRDPGYIKAYPPGIRENGGQYSHAAAWVGLAFAARRDGDRAARVLDWLNPIARAATLEDLERYRTEPYVLAADIGSVPPHAGRGGWTWYTGSSGWTWRLVVEGLLGLRLRGGRLRIEPCPPLAWDRFEAEVQGAAGTLVITVELSSDLEPDRREVLVDGVPFEEDDIAFPVDGSSRAVHVRVGRRAARAAAASARLGFHEA